jgi:hypothetical protein
MNHVRREINAALLLPLMLFALSSPRAEEKLPDVEAVLDGYVEATGGREAYDKIHNRVTRGELEIVGQGIVMNLTIYLAKPNKNYTVVESEALGTIEKGTDGEVVWEKSAMLGPQVKDGQEKIDFLRETRLDRWTYWRDQYDEVALEGIETIDERPCYKVVATPGDGKPQMLFFDQASNLLVKIELVVENPMGTIPVASYLSDYREVDGALLPFKSKVVVMGQERVMTTKSIEQNVDLPADRFEIPAEIRALLKTSDGAGAGQTRPPAG